MNADSTFIIGATHSVCQDYAIAGYTAARKTPYVILSDGCSTSPDTDIGARLLVKAAAQTMNDQDEDLSILHESAARLALSWARLISVPPQSVDATLLTAQVRGTELLVSGSGDGVIVVEKLAGSLDVYSISYLAGYPFYPAYLHQPDRLEALLTNNRASKEIRHFHSTFIDKPFELVSTYISESATQVFSFNAADYKSVALISDGIHSFFRTDQKAGSKRIEPVLMPEVVGEIVSFKSWNGSFVQRRVNRFLKECRAKGWQHADDLSLAVIHLGGPECSLRVPSRV